MRRRFLAVAVMLAAAAPPGARGQEPGEKPAAPAEINKPFEKPDVKAYIRRFEDESREVYARREAIVDAVGLKPGMAVADVGAGTGLFTRLFAERVGAGGKVYAVDVAPAFLEHIAAESRRRGQDQVRTVRGTQRATGLAPGAVDVAFLCDVYHHLEHPAAVLGSIHRALRPAGRLVVIDFDRREGVSGAFVLQHVRAGKATFRAEIEAAGFEPAEVADAPKLTENFFLAFRKKEGRSAPPRAAYIRAGRLFDGTGDEYRNDVVIVVAGGRIEAVGPASEVPVPAGATVLDLSGATVLPGLIDCHTHLGSRADRYDEIYKFKDTPNHGAFAAVLHARKTLEAGFTTVRDVGSRPFLAVDLRDAIEEGFLVGPRVVASGPGISMTGGHGDLNRYSPQTSVATFPEERDFKIADGVDQVRHVVRAQLKHGVDVVKVHASGGVLSRGDSPGAPQFTVAELRAAVEEAHAAGR